MASRGVLDEKHAASSNLVEASQQRASKKASSAMLGLLLLYSIMYFVIRYHVEGFPVDFSRTCSPEEEAMAHCVVVPSVPDTLDALDDSWNNNNNSNNNNLLKGKEREKEEGLDKPPPLAAADPSAPGPLVAVIVETQMASNLVPLIIHFSTVLGPDWTVILFTLEETFVMPSSSPFLRLVEQGAIDIRFMPAATDLSTSNKVSNFLSKPWLWEQVEWAYRVLFFQLDSIICSRSPRRVEDFLEFDFVGAPISPGYGEGYNGGFCLRNPRVFLEIAREADFENQVTGPDGGRRIDYEDQWFYAEAKKRVSTRGVRLATVDEAVKFSVETIYQDRPLGYHQPNLFNPEHQDEIAAWCPEVKLVMGKRAM